MTYSNFLGYLEDSTFLEYAAMHILLININPVVSRLFALCVRDKHMDLEEVHSANAVSRDRYDVAFVDEASYVQEVRDVLANLMIEKKVFLSSSAELHDGGGMFDMVIKKPFLPSQITAVLEALEAEEVSEEAVEAPSLYPIPEDIPQTDEEAEEGEPNVLDLGEIDRIKALLDMEEEILPVLSDDEIERRKVEVIKQQLIADGLEIVDEDAYVEALSKKPSEGKKKKEKSAKKKKAKAKKKHKKEEEVFTFEEALIAAVEGMKVKKIKKLLKGAEVTIKIEFKDGK
jgi:hypothetical protein